MVKRFCDKYHFTLVTLNNGYQLRIENVLDVYPVRGRWCWLPTGERGGWDNANDLRAIMLKHLPPKLETDGYIQPRKPMIFFDEASNIDPKELEKVNWPPKQTKRLERSGLWQSLKNRLLRKLNRR